MPHLVGTPPPSPASWVHFVKTAKILLIFLNLLSHRWHGKCISEGLRCCSGKLGSSLSGKHKSGALRSPHEKHQYGKMLIFQTLVSVNSGNGQGLLKLTFPGF